ncbi:MULTISPECIES: spore cortex-lytic enzyme [Paenibacillus]|uniref:Spore cortex-lytic enzyme n=1 Tax=Paenibacillus vini TaxID=1476024 RepID=A0ABQ4MCI1_9BACL|nr:spore cortex-lytic enzyme [Paenibacillus vini]MDN4071005.1 spore cortex-lytic enzyme [Paenibacillus vini]GIP53698.1 spore cortex-lytic enzyme [Paenibacillus vini]
MKIFRTFIILIIATFTIGLFGGSTQAAAPGKLNVGSNGGDVWDLQYRLKALGLFNLELTGYYGTSTKSSVQNFQKTYGLQVDGVSGPQTWQALKKYSLNQSEMDILAKVIYSEARGESYKGQVAVGAVVLNRLQSDQFPDTIKDVVFQPRAFTAVDDGQYYLTPDRTAYLAAQDAVRGWDPTYGSLYYFNPETATSEWIWSRPQKIKIGNHIFAG